MKYRDLALGLAAWAALACAAAAEAPDRITASIACKLGHYVFPDGGWAIVQASTYETDSLSYLLSDREVGELSQVNPDVFVEDAPRPALRFEFAECGSGKVIMTKGSGPALEGRRVNYPERELAIRQGDVTLAAKLVQPRGRPARHAVVWATGSNQIGDANRTDWQYLLPMQGVAVLVLDKRGTGGSSGDKTANFHLRADDVLAAVGKAREVLGKDVEVGVFGVSQGGWVAPLAAARGGVDFVVVGYGLAEGVPAEDRDELVQNLKAAGYGDADIAKALELQAAATVIAKSRWRDGWETFDALKAKYKDEPWIRAIGTDGYTGLMVATPSEQVKVLGPQLDLGISFDYDPGPTIAGLKTRQLWILGGADTSAPSAGTRAILEGLQPTKPNLDLVVFPAADHGIVEVETAGGKTHRRLSDGYWRLVAEWIKTRRIPPLPPGAIVRPGDGRVR